MIISSPNVSTILTHTYSICNFDERKSNMYLHNYDSMFSFSTNDDSSGQKLEKIVQYQKS